MSKAYEYFQWCDKNPWIKKEAIKSGDYAGTLIDIPTQRPYTLEGLCLYLGISLNTFKNYQDRKGFMTVTTHVREIIDANQLEGAAVGAYNANIIARKLGLAEKAETNVKLHGEYADLSDEELTKKLKYLNQKMNDAQGEDTAN